MPVNRMYSQILGVKKKLLLFLIVNTFFITFTDDIQIVVIHIAEECTIL